MKNLNAIKRILRMERYFDEVNSALASHTVRKTTMRKLRTLEKYMASGLWLKDYECDEKGALPKDLKRGVLSEDGLYNLLSDMECY